MWWWWWGCYLRPVQFLDHLTVIITNNEFWYYVIIFNNQTINQEEEAEDGKEGEVHEGHQHALELVSVGHRSSLIIGKGSRVIFFAVDVQKIEFLSRKICVWINETNIFPFLIVKIYYVTWDKYLSRRKTDVLEKGPSRSKGLARCVWKSEKEH